MARRGRNWRAEEKGEEGGARTRRETGRGGSAANEPTGRGSRRSASTTEPSGPSYSSRPGRGRSALYVGRLGLGPGRGHAWGGASTRPRGAGLRAVTSAAAGVGDYPLLLTFAPLNNREHSEEGEFPAAPARAPSSRPGPAQGRREPKWLGCSEAETEILGLEVPRQQAAGAAAARHSLVRLRAGRRRSRARYGSGRRRAGGRAPCSRGALALGLRERVPRSRDSLPRN